MRFPYAARSLAKNPLFTAVVVISLGLALALNTTMFALVDAVLYPTLPYREPERVVTPSFIGGNYQSFVPWEERYRAVREGLTTYDAIASYTILPAMVQTATVAEDRWVAAVSPGLFDVLGVRPAVGRGLAVGDASSQSNQEVLISLRLWTRYFNRRPLEGGLTLGVGKGTYTVVGIMPRGVHFPGDADVWIPVASVPSDTAIRRVGPFPAFRLKNGATLERARAELAVVAARLTSRFSPKRPLSARVSTLGPGRPPPAAFPSFLPGTVAMVLIIAAANLGTMMLARGMARRREMAIRVALGADRTAVVSHVLAECALIVAGGVGLGVLLSVWALHVVPHLATPVVPLLGDISPVPSWRVFSAVLAASVGMLLLAGVIPALRAAAIEPAEPMKEGAGATTGRLRDRYNPLLVVEVALSTALLMCTALFVIYSARLAAFEFRYAAKRLVVASISPRTKSFANDTAVARFYHDLLARAVRLPGASAAATRHFEKPDGGVVISEEGPSGEAWMNSSAYAVVSSGYFRTLGIPLVAGRDFAPADDGAAAEVVIVDEEAARRLWPDLGSPIGRMIKLGAKSSRRPWLRVIGVCRAVELQPRKDNTLPPEPAIYVANGHDAARQRDLIVRSDAAGGDRGRASLALALRREIQSAAPDIGGVWVRPWLDRYESSRSTSAFMAALFAAFSAFGLLLCAGGLYGVLAYSVSRRLREFAVRIALGARGRDVARIVVHDAAVTALAGVGIGAFVALWTTRAISDELFAVSYADFFALVAAEGVLLLVALAACVGPVRQALRADPMTILRAS